MANIGLAFPSGQYPLAHLRTSDMSIAETVALGPGALTPERAICVSASLLFPARHRCHRSTALTFFAV